VKLYVESAADAVTTGKLSVAQAVSESTDEFVELDEEGENGPARKKGRAAAPKKAGKVTVRKKAAGRATEAEAEEAGADTTGE
jgi:hypothetical protein